MERPDIELVNELESMRCRIEEAQDTIERLTKRMNEVVHDMAYDVEDQEQRKEVATYIYWAFPEVKVSNITYAILGQEKASMHKLLAQESFTYRESCQGCGCSNTVVARTRTSLLALRAERRKKPYLCRKCDVEAIRRAWEWNQELLRRMEEQKARSARLGVLKSMPYKDYLRTPEWQKTRERALYRANCACQVCNAKNCCLNVHHRTYERRGDELNEDLVVLCRDCHELFHREGKLAHH